MGMSHAHNYANRSINWIKIDKRITISDNADEESKVIIVDSQQYNRNLASNNGLISISTASDPHKNCPIPLSLWMDYIEYH